MGRAYEAERRRIIHHRAVTAGILALVLVPLFGVVDYFMYRPHFTTLATVRLVSSVVSAAVLLVLRRPFGRQHPLGLVLLLAVQVGLAIAAIPVYVTGTNTPHYVSMSLLILSLAALFPWRAVHVVFLSVALAATFMVGALLHGAVSRPTAFFTEVSAILVTGVIAVIITALGEAMRRREFAARRALRAASGEKTRLIRDLEQKRGELERVNRDLAGLNQEMEDLLYVASHDLRAPLINVQGFANELSLGLTELRPHTDGAPEARAVYTDLEESLRFVQSAVGRMDGLIRGLLSVSRIATRTNPAEEVRLTNVVEKIVESFRFQLDAHRISVTVGELPSVRGDAMRLTQVFSNLMDNAIKYMGESACRTIEIGARNGNRFPTLFVRDSGPGIPAESRETVFRLFRRLAVDVPGEGLGLTLVRKIVEKHGGRIWVESAAGHGSTFCFTLHEREERPVRGETPAPAAGGSRDGGVRV